MKAEKGKPFKRAAAELGEHDQKATLNNDSDATIEMLVCRFKGKNHTFAKLSFSITAKDRK